WGARPARSRACPSTRPPRTSRGRCGSRPAWGPVAAQLRPAGNPFRPAEEAASPRTARRRRRNPVPAQADRRAKRQSGSVSSRPPRITHETYGGGGDSGGLAVLLVQERGLFAAGDDALGDL